MKRAIIPESVTAGDWPKVELSAIPLERQETFQNRKLAIEMYLEARSYEEIELITGICSSEINRLFERFCKTDSSGRVLGELALVPWFRTEEYTRKKDSISKRSSQKGGCSGEFKRLLRQHPEIEEELISIIINSDRDFTLLEPSARYISHLTDSLCKMIDRLNLSSGKWPSNTKSLGRRTMHDYVGKLVNENFVKFLRAHGSSAAKAHLATGTGKRRQLHPSRPFDVLQIDGHYIDAAICIRIRLLPEIMNVVFTTRIWLLHALDAHTNATMAYRLVLRSEVASADVRALIADACIGKWSRKLKVVEDIDYLSDAALPSGVLAVRGNIFSCLCVDSHLSNIAEKITTNARYDFGFVHNVGPVKRFEARAEIERVFKEVAERAHLLSSSTGSNPSQGRPDHPEGKAIEYDFDLDKLEYILDVYLANHCATPTEGLGFLSPLAVIQQYINSGCLFPALTDMRMERVARDMATQVCAVRGSIEHGRRPYIQLDRVHYTNSILAQTPELIGVNLTVEVDYNDYRVVQAWLPSGESIGQLAAMGFWSDFKHSVTARKLINSLLISRKLHISPSKETLPQILKCLTDNNCELAALSIQKEAGGGSSHIEIDLTDKANEPEVELVTSRGIDLPIPGTNLTKGR